VAARTPQHAQLRAGEENPGFWHKFQQHTGVDYDRSLFIDDSLTCCDGRRLKVCHI